MLIQVCLCVPMCPKKTASAVSSPLPNALLFSTKPCHLPLKTGSCESSRPASQPSLPCFTYISNRKFVLAFAASPHIKPSCRISHVRVRLFFFLSKTDHVCQEDSLLKDKLYKTLITMNMSLSFIPIRSESRERLDTLLGVKIRSLRDFIRRHRTICAGQCVCYLELMLYVTLHFEVSVFLKLLSLLLLFCLSRD